MINFCKSNPQCFRSKAMYNISILKLIEYEPFIQCEPLPIEKFKKMRRRDFCIFNGKEIFISYISPKAPGYRIYGSDFVSEFKYLNKRPFVTTKYYRFTESQINQLEKSSNILSIPFKRKIIENLYNKKLEFEIRGYGYVRHSYKIENNRIYYYEGDIGKSIWIDLPRDILDIIKFIQC